MLNINEIKESQLENFSRNRKNMLKKLVKIKIVDEKLLDEMIKDSKGRLKINLKKFKNSAKNVEDICDIAGVLTIDEQELVEVEIQLAKNLSN